MSNDDGYQASGINVLAETLSEISDIVMVAPDRNRSGASNSLTLEAPLRLREFKRNYFYINGTPTDCVHLAVTGLLDELPDMVVSGINHGANLGDDVLYSGTVAAATEGRFLGLPSIAISLATSMVGEGRNFQTAANVAKDLVLRLLSNPLPSSTILNVNVPDLPLSDLGEYEVTRLGARHCARPSIKKIDPRGREIYWIGLSGDAQDAGPGTDFHAISAGNVSITPLKIEWTNYPAFDQISSWVSGLNQTLYQ